MKRIGLVLIALLLAATFPAPSPAAILEESSAPNDVSLSVGYNGFSYQTTATEYATMGLYNNDPNNYVTVTSITASDPIPSFLTASYNGGLPFSIAPNQFQSFTIAVTAQSNNGQTRGSFTSTVDVDSDNGSVQFHIPIQVTDRRAPYADLSDSTATYEMPCPKSFDTSSATFSVVVSNTGDFSLTVYSLSISGLPYFVQALDSTGFTLGRQGSSNPSDSRTVRFRMNIPGDAPERIFYGSVSVSASSNTDAATLTFNLTHPVDVTLPKAGATYDFGEVELMRDPKQPWSHEIQEFCGYKDGVIQIGTPLPPDFVALEPDPVLVPAGGTTTFSVTPRFNSTHVGLLLHPQNFQVQLTANDGDSRTYSFTATPSFIDVSQLKADLADLSTSSPVEDGREAAQRTRALVINRTETHRPTTAEELEDAGRIVGLAEPVVLAVEQLGNMQTWNSEGRENDTVQTLSVLVAGLDALDSVCEAIIDPVDGAECAAIIGVLEAAMRRFALDARSHFEAETSSARSSLEQVEASRGLALALDALGDADGAAELRERADTQFEEFTTRLASADAHLGAIEAREASFVPGAFVRTDTAYVAWNPIGMLVLRSFRSYALEQFDAARGELQSAGENNRVRDVDAEQQAFEARVATGTLVSLVITAAYVALLVGGGLRFGVSILRKRSDRSLLGKGDLLLGRVPPSP